MVQENDVVSTIGCTGPTSICTSAMGFTPLIVSGGDRENETNLNVNLYREIPRDLVSV